MKAYQVKKYGKKEILHLTELPEPTLYENEVLIQVHTAGVNVIDLMLRNGEFKLFLPMKPPFQLGRDVAGVVTKIGTNVSQFKVGDEVFGYTGDQLGGHAAIALIQEKLLIKKSK